ncbi:uncharacterized protein LOC143290359 isoform X2 [Babylonia areolata]
MMTWVHHSDLRITASAPSPRLLLLAAGLACLPTPLSAGCGGVFTNPTGVLTSPGYPGSYPYQQDCVYVIQRGEGERISLAFHELDLEYEEDCGADHLLIREGDSESGPIRKRMCGSDPPTSVITSFSNALWIRFYSDDTHTAGGFKITYTTVTRANEQFFLLSGLMSVYIMHAGEGGFMALPIQGLYLPTALEFDPVERRVYWSDEGIGEVRSAFVNGSDWKTVHRNQEGEVSKALALDPVARLLFVAESPTGRIVMRSLLTAHRRTVLTGLTDPTSLALDYSEGTLFWLEYSLLKSSILRASYDGRGVKTIVSRFLLDPRCLAVDRATKRLYWVDALSEKVEWSDYQGQGRSSQVSDFTGTSFAALAVSSTHLHVVDWGKKGRDSTTSILRQMEKDGSNDTATAITRFRARDILFHDDSTWKAETNGCGGARNGGCSHLCVPVDSRRSTRCLCPDLHVLSADGSSCTPRSGSRHKTHSVDDDDDDDDDDDNRWDDYITREAEEPPETVRAATKPAQQKPTQQKPTTTSQRRQQSRQQPAQNSKHQGRPPSEPASDLNRPIAAKEVRVTGPRPFDTDGSRVMSVTCVHEGRYTLWTGVRCEEEGGRVCKLRPRVPDDDGLVVRCLAFFGDGSRGEAAFTLHLNYPPQSPPRITGYTPGRPVQVGEALHMTCTVQGGRPLVTAVDFTCPGHPDTEPDEEGRGKVTASVTIPRLTSWDHGVTCVCWAEWKVPELYVSRAYVTLSVTSPSSASSSAVRGGGKEEL